MRDKLAASEEVKELRAHIAALEASVHGLRQELQTERRRRLAPWNGMGAHAGNHGDFQTSRAYRLCLAYYSLFGLPVLGPILTAVRRAVALAVRRVRQRG